jgi:hypothetical protein
MGPISPEQRRLFRRLWAIRVPLLVVCLLGPHWLFRSGFQTVAVPVAGLSFLGYFCLHGWMGDRLRFKLHPDQSDNSMLLTALCFCAMLGSLLYLIFAFVALTVRR